MCPCFHSYFCILVSRLSDQAEGAYFLVINICLLVFRLPRAQHDEPVSFPVFLSGFVSAYTLALHVGFLLGNGFHAVSTNSRKIMQLYLWAKIVFSSLTLMETSVMLSSVLSQQGTGDTGTGSSAYAAAV